jgi:hypothetical protein
VTKKSLLTGLSPLVHGTPRIAISRSLGINGTEMGRWLSEALGGKSCDRRIREGHDGQDA